MSTYTAQRSASTSAYPHLTSPSPVSVVPVSEDEPDEEWKRNKRREIENGFQSMIQEAKDRYENNLQGLTFPKNSPEWNAQKAEYFKEFEEESGFIRGLALEEFTHAVANERVTRRVSRLGVGSINPVLQGSMVQEQEAILAQIQRDRKDSTSTQTDSPSASGSTSGSSSAQKSRVPQREASRPTFASDSYSSASGIPSRPPASPETFKSPTKPYRPEDPPTERPSVASASASASAPPPSASDNRFGSLGRTAASPTQERRGSASQPYTSAPSPSAPTTSSSLRRAPTSPAAVSPPPANGPRVGSSWQTPTQERTVPAAPSPPGSLRRAPTSQTWIEATSTPIHADHPSPLSAKRSQSNFHPAPPPNPIPAQSDHHDRAGASPLRAKRSQASFHAAPPPPNPNPAPVPGNHHDRAGPSPLSAKRSESSLHASPPPTQGVHASQAWFPQPRYTEEPEELSDSDSDSERVAPTRRTPDGPPPPDTAARPPPQVWTPSPTAVQQEAASRLKRSGSGARPSPGARGSIPAPFMDAAPPPPPTPPPAPAPAPVDVRANAEREAAQRRESERLWTNLDRSREKGARHGSSASEQLLPRPPAAAHEHVSGGAPSLAEGSSASPTRPPDNSSGSGGGVFPNARVAGPPDGLRNPSSLHSSYPSAPFVPRGSGGLSATQPPSVSPSSFFGRDASTDEDSEEDDYSYHAPRSYSPEPLPSSSHPPDSRASSYSYSQPIPVPRRSHTPEAPPLVYSAGEYSRWGMIPPTPPPEARSGYAESSSAGPSLNSGSSFGSYSSRREDAGAAAAERERKLEQELERERERERERDQERERLREVARAAQKAEEEAQRKVEEAKRKEEAAQKKEADLRRQQEETERKLKEIDEREADLRRREAEVRRREEETRQKEMARQREEAEKLRKEKERQKAEAEAEKQKAQTEQQQQRAFQARADEIKRQTEERKRQGSVDGDWGYTSWGTPPRASPASPSPSNTTSSSTRSSTTGSSTTGPTWSSSSRASSTASASQSSSSPRASSTTAPNGMPTWTSSSSTATPPNSAPYSSSAGSQTGARPSASSTSKPAPRTSTSQPNPSMGNPDERARRQREQAEEQFRKMQEQLERERQAKEQKAGRMLSKEDVVRIYQLHEQQWSKMSAHSEVTWDLLPWPMYKKPNSAEEITSAAVDAYIMSPHYPDQDKSTKDRVRQQLRRWHEDHFNQKVLSKVSERDKERVKAAAGTVTRNLNNLLERANESKKSASSVFA